MPTVADAYNAAVDAVIADNTLNRGGFVDAIQTVITQGLSNAEGNAFCDALAVLYQSLNQINNPTYNNLRGDIIDDGASVAKEKFVALAAAINVLPETEPVIQAAALMDLREDRDQINNAIDRLDALIAAEPAGTVGKLVKETMRAGKDQLREYRQRVRDAIQSATGDPDS